MLALTPSKVKYTLVYIYSITPIKLTFLISETSSYMTLNTWNGVSYNVQFPSLYALNKIDSQPIFMLAVWRLILYCITIINAIISHHSLLPSSDIICLDTMLPYTCRCVHVYHPYQPNPNHRSGFDTVTIC